MKPANRFEIAPRPLAKAVRVGAICIGMGVALFTAACGAAAARPSPHSPAYMQGGAPAEDNPRAAALTKAAAHWARRADRTELEKAIALFTEASREAGPQSRSAHVQLAHAHHLMGHSILTFGWAQASDAAQHFALGAAAASSALASDAPNVAAAIEAQRAPAPSELRGPEQGALAYWLAASWHAAAELGGMADIALREAAVRSLLERAVELSPDVDRGGAFRLLAELHAHPAHAPMRNLTLAREALDRALNVSGADLRNVLAYVEHYALPAQDAAVASERLREALAANGSSAEDRIAQARAKRLAAELDGSLE